MAPTKPKKAETATTPKKEKVFHPASRKAGQLVRMHLRKGKLSEQASNRNKKDYSLGDFYGFFFHALPPEGNMTLTELHDLINDVWLKRHDAELGEERTARRKGRPKSVKESKLEEIKLVECEQYKNGMEVVDLTHTSNVELFRKWDQREVSYAKQLRHIRICSTSPNSVIVTKLGEHPFLLQQGSTAESSPDQEMEAVENISHEQAPFSLGLPPSKFASTMMTMDGPI